MISCCTITVKVTLLDSDGNVLFDTDPNVISENHKERPEVTKAFALGQGYTIRRLSKTDHRDYFYSAKKSGSVVVRTALPYSVNLSNVLKGDADYVWLFLGTTIVVNIILYFAIRQISQGVRNLKQFAQMAKDGDIGSYDMSELRNDELGEVSAVIINLYKNMKRASEERDRNMREALFEEKEKIRIKHQLTSNINHELKTPVQSIRGCFETILDNFGALDRETERRLLDSGYKNTMRLTELLQDIALITRMTDAKATLEKAEMNVREVVDAVAEEMNNFPLEKRMRVNIDIPKDTVIKGNRQLVEAIFRNLMNNAVSYSGGRDIFIAMTKETPDMYWFDFYDNGSGVEDKHLSRIFERFYRIDSGRSRKSGGTGLGLSIVRNAVQFHGGEINAQNRQYSGLEFIFSLKK